MLICQRSEEAEKREQERRREQRSTYVLSDSVRSGDGQGDRKGLQLTRM